MFSWSRREFLGYGLATWVGWWSQAWPKRGIMESDQLVQFLWSGALTPSSIKINAKLLVDSANVRLHVSRSPFLTDAFISIDPYPSDQGTNQRVVAMSMVGLLSDTTYYYGVSVDDVIDWEHIGKFHTPELGTYSFRFAFASCAKTGSTHPVFDRIRTKQPLFFIHMGDFHYQNIDVDNRSLFRDAYETVLASPQQSQLFQDIPIAYIWDDHDYGRNDSDGTSPSKEAARLTYQQYVPHYPLAAGSGNVPIYQAFTIGRVRFILTDLRSERDRKTVPADHPDKTMMGITQKAWFKQELLDAKDTHGLIVWMSSTPWISGVPGSGNGLDKWNGFEVERREIADFLQENHIENLLFISGDKHMLAIDDGSYNVYSSDGQPGFPIMQAASLDKEGTYFDDVTYSEGQYPNRGQFGIIDVFDNGEGILLQLWGMNANDEVVVQWEWNVGNALALDHQSYLPFITK